MLRVPSHWTFNHRAEKLLVQPRVVTESVEEESLQSRQYSDVSCEGY